MRVLVACEYSGVVRRAFKKRGHTVISCDLLPSEDDSPDHIIGDVTHLLNDGWDLMIAHPPCTYLANSGWHWTVRDKTGERWKHAEKAAEFFMTLWKANIPKIAVENPIPGPLLSKVAGRFSQTIQPYMFGDDASKRTCLWLKNLTPLELPSTSQWVQPRIIDGKPRWSNQTDAGQNKLSSRRSHERSRTYDGIAEAFASNWA